MNWYMNLSARLPSYADNPQLSLERLGEIHGKPDEETEGMDQDTQISAKDTAKNFKKYNQRVPIMPNMDAFNAYKGD